MVRQQDAEVGKGASRALLNPQESSVNGVNGMKRGMGGRRTTQGLPIAQRKLGVGLGKAKKSNGVSDLSGSVISIVSGKNARAGVEAMRWDIEKALDGRKPSRETKGRKKGGAVRQIPVGVNTKRGKYRVGKWLRNGVRSGRQSTGEGSAKALMVATLERVGKKASK